MQDLPENHFRVSGASWLNIIKYSSYYYYKYYCYYYYYYYYYWVRLIMATQVNCSSLELIVAFPVFVNAMFAGDGLIYVSCSGEYFECAILLDRLYLGVSSMHLDILFPDTMFCASTFLRGVRLSVSVCLNLFFDTQNIRLNLHFALLRPFFLSTRPG